MKATVRFNAGNGFWVEIEAEGVKQAVKMMSEYLEVFGVKQCGKCQAQTLVCQHNQDRDGHDYYKLRCTSCGALLDFGQHKTGGTLFVKRKDKDENLIPDGGWYYWKDRRRNDDGDINQDREGSPF